MKQLVKIFLVVCLLPVLAKAQPAGRQAWGKQWKDRLENLNLTESQKEQLKTLRERMREESQSILKNDALTPSEKQDKITALREFWQAELAKILTPEQLAKWKQMQPGPKNYRLLENWEEIVSALDLTAEQKEKIKPLLQKGAEQAKSILQDNSLSKEEKKEKVQSLWKETRAALRETLTQQQWQKLQEKRKEAIQRYREKNRG